MTNLRVDLHMHTTSSDGTWSPEELVKEIKKNKIDVFAVTDHDSVDSVLKTEKIAKAKKLFFVRGVEISSTRQGQFYHILGYHIDPHHKALKAHLEENHKRLIPLNDRAFEYLEEQGHHIDYEAYDHYTYDKKRGGWKFLNFIIDSKICKGIDDFFTTLFAGRLDLLFANFPDPKEAAQVIIKAGGIPILAHPDASLKEFSLDEKNEILDDLVKSGVAGLECHSTYHKPEATKKYLEYCKKKNLLITGGSDCHGGFVISRHLGEPEVYLSDLNLGPIFSVPR